MADPQTADQGFLAGLLGKFGADPAAAYGGLLSDPATQRQFALRSLGAAAQAFGQGAMPVPYKGGIPFGATLGAAGGAASTAGDELIKARLEQAQSELAQQQASLAHGRVGLVNALPGMLQNYYGADGGQGGGAATGAKPLTGPAAIIAGKGKLVSSTTADDTLPAPARALLDTISGPESGGAYNVRYDGNKDATFGSFDAHPGVKATIPEGQPYAGSTSDAAGRYQFLGSTWRPIAQKYGFSDFSPVTQDQGAWHLAADTYAAKTNRDLLTDLQNGDTSRVASALHGQWPTLSMGSYGGNLAKYAQPPQTASTGDQPPAAAPGSQVGPYAPVPGQPPPQGVYVPPGASPNAPPVRIEGGPPAPAAPPGGLLKLPDPTSAAPPQLLTPPAVTGLLGQQPTQQVAAADAPQLSPAAAAILQGINRQQAGGGLLASGSVAGGNAVPTGEPPAVTQQSQPPHTGAAGAAELAGLLAQPPAPAGPPTATPYTNAPPVTGQGAPAPGPGPAPTPQQAPAVAQAPTAPDINLTGVPSPQKIAQARQIEAAFNALGMTPPADIVKTATFPLDVALEAEKKRAALPYTPFRPNSSLPIMGPDGKTIIGWQTAPAGPTIGPGPPTADQQPTQQIVYPATTPGGAPAVVPIPGPSGLSPQQTASGTASGTNRANLGGLPSTPFGQPSAPVAVPSAVSPSLPPPPTLTGPTIVGGETLKPAPITPTTPEGTLITPRGTNLPPPTQQFMPQSAEELRKLVTDAPALTRAWTDSIEPARTAELRLETMYRAYQMMQSGAYTTQKTEFQRLLNAIGIPPNIISSNKIGDVQVALHENILSSLPALRENMPRPTQFEFKTVSANRANPDLEPAANMQMLSEDIAQARQTQYLARDWNTAQQIGWRNPDSFKTVWGDMNKPAVEVDRVKQQFGPVKGAAPDLPTGSVDTGRTYQGKPIYNIPDGKGGFKQQVLH